MKSKSIHKGNRANHHLVWILGLLALTALFFFSRGFLVLIYTLVLPGVLLTLLVWAWKRLFSFKKHAGDKTLSNIQKRFRTCDKHIEKQKKELAEIAENMAELKEQLHAKFEISSAARAETEALIKAFCMEKQLREQKITFFLSVKEKVLGILYHQEVLERLKEKRQKLSQLRADHLDDLADMENLRQDVAFDQGYMDALQSLELKMARTNKLDTVEAIQLEFDKMIKELS